MPCRRKKFPEALAKLKEAEGNPKKTPYDQHIIMSWRCRLLRRPATTRNLQGVRAEINDGFLDGGVPAASRPWHR